MCVILTNIIMPMMFSYISLHTAGITICTFHNPSLINKYLVHVTIYIYIYILYSILYCIIIVYRISVIIDMGSYS